MIASLQSLLGCDFDKNAKLPINVGVNPDAIDPINKIVVEVYARVGEVRGAQLHKIKGDILKLALLKKGSVPGGAKLCVLLQMKLQSMCKVNHGWQKLPRNSGLKFSLLNYQKRKKKISFQPKRDSAWLTHHDC